MKRRRRVGAPRTSPPGPRGGSKKGRGHESWVLWPLWALVLLPPLVVDVQAKDSFRLPKELVSEILIWVSLLFLCWRLRFQERVEWRRLFRHPAFAATLPLFLVVTLSSIVSDHPEHVRQGWSVFATGAAALVGWSLALTWAEKRRLLFVTIFPAGLLALFAIVQAHGVFNPFEIEGRVNERRELTSLAGGALDLGTYLVLPALVAQWCLYRSKTNRQRAGSAALLAVVLYALARTETLTALAALALASFVLWAPLLSARRMALVGALLAVLSGSLVLGVEPLRERMDLQLRRFSEGKVNRLLTGRLDGWRAAIRMMEKSPWLGVGPGAFTTEFAPSKQELSAEGVAFFERHFEPHFASAHNEYLEVAAESGGLGLAALGWGIFVLLRELVRKRRTGAAPADFALMASGLAALAVTALASFPMQLAIVAIPHLILWSLVLGSGEESEAAT